MTNDWTYSSTCGKGRGYTEADAARKSPTELGRGWVSHPLRSMWMPRCSARSLLGRTCRLIKSQAFRVGFPRLFAAKPRNPALESSRHCPNGWFPHSSTVGLTVDQREQAWSVEKHGESRLFSCSCTCIFFPLTLPLLWSSFFFSSLISDTSQLCFSIYPYCWKFDF